MVRDAEALRARADVARDRVQIERRGAARGAAVRAAHAARRGVVDGARALLIEPGRTITSAKVDGAAVTVPAGATSIRLELTMSQGKPIAFEVR